MDTIGIDVHKKESQVCILTDEGKLLEPPRIPTTVEALRKRFGGRRPARILIESSTESEWVARVLEGWATRVVAD
jgi:hypothetical protein